MRKSFVANNLVRIALLTVLALLAAGCATTTPEIVRAPVYSSDTSQQAVYAGVRAMADFRREHFIAVARQRPADYTAPRQQLAQALGGLRPSPLAPGSPAYGQHVICFETALAAMDRIGAAERRNDREDAAIGWEMLDQSAKALVPLLVR